MAKTESTAVNALIDLVKTQTPLKKDRSEDVMFSAPPTGRTGKSSPRVTGSMSAMRGGEVAPLPRRTGVGTQQNLPPAAAAAPPPMRMSPNSVRTMTIPPLARRVDPYDTSLSRETQPTIPPPLGVLRAGQGTPAPQLFSTRSGATLPLPNRTLPPSTPAFRPSAPMSAPVPMAMAMPMTMPIAAPFEPATSYPAAASSSLNAMQPWLDEELGDEAELALAPAIAPQADGTEQLDKATTLALLGKLIVPMLLLVIVGVFVGGYIAFDGDGGTKSRASVAAAAPSPTAVVPATEPAALPAVEPAPVVVPTAVAAIDPVAETKPTVEAPAVAAIEPPAAVEPIAPVRVVEPKPAPVMAAFVDIRIDSKPSGATVMLVDRGKTTFLGNTPISTSVDPSRSYDIVFTSENRPTQLEHVDPSTMTHLAVVLGKPGNVAKVAKPAPAAVEIKTVPQVVKPVTIAAKPAKTAPIIVEPTLVKVTKPVVAKPAAKPAKVAVAKAVTEAPAAKKAQEPGILMISSKPPCEIYVDGKSTGLTTPQRALSLSSGTHKITLVNADKTIKKTFAVQITADKPTKVIQDLMKP